MNDDINREGAEENKENEKKAHESKIKTEEGVHGDEVFADKKEKEEEEEEEKSNTLEEYLASQSKLKSFRKEARKPEELKKANIEKTTESKNKVSTLSTNLKS